MLLESHRSNYFVEHSVETSAKFPILSWYQRTILFHLYVGEATESLHLCSPQKSYERQHCVRTLCYLQPFYSLSGDSFTATKPKMWCVAYCWPRHFCLAVTLTCSYVYMRNLQLLCRSVSMSLLWSSSREMPGTTGKNQCPQTCTFHI